MKKWLSLALAVMLLFVGFTGCNDNGEEGENPDNKNGTGLDAVVATVNDAEIKRGEVEELLYSQLGYWMSFLSESDLKTYREQCLTILIQQEVARQKAAELGYSQLTEEDLAEIDSSYQTFYDNGIQHFIDILKEEDAENGVFDEVIESTDYTNRAEERLIAYLEENNYYSIARFEGETLLDKYKNYIKDSYIVSYKLLPGVTSHVTVNEDAVKAEYDALLKEQKASYDESGANFESAVSSNQEYQYYYGENAVNIVYVPEGMRYVKHILIMFSEETQTTMGEKESALSTAEYDLETEEEELKTAQKAVEEAADDAALATAQTALETAQTEYDTAKKAYETAKKAYDDALTTATAEIQEKVTEVYGKVQDGEDFETLITTYGEDPGMENEMYKETGYLLCADSTTYYDIFTTTGMSLEKVGDYSEPVYSSVGAHIIQFTSQLEAGALPYEKVKADIEKTLLVDAQNKAFTELLTEWEKSGFTITQYTDALNATIEEETKKESE